MFLSSKIVPRLRYFFILKHHRIKCSNHSYQLVESPNLFITNLRYFHRRTSKITASSRQIRNDNQNNQDQNDDEKKRNVIYSGLIIFASILAFYFYERRNQIRMLDHAKLWSRAEQDNIISDDDVADGQALSKNKNKLSGSGGGKYASLNFFADIVEQASPSVVFIQAQGQHPFAPMHLNISSGSGFLVDKKDGIILTNAHVIANCQKVAVRFNDGREMYGTVEFVDERLDLATVRVPVDKIKDLQPLPLGDSKQARAGEWVIAVGSPFSLANTVTVGVISSSVRAGRDLGIGDSIEYIQTDASINVGNSGGPLLNLDGEAIGINTLKVGEGISFAIPSYYAKEFLKQCNKYRHYYNSKSWWSNRSRNEIDSSLIPEEPNQAPVPNRRMYLGFTIVTLTPHLIESHRHRDPSFPPDIQEGVMIYRVVLGAPAHLNGLEAGDIIVAVDGKKIRTADEVYRMIQNCQTTEIEFHVKRGLQDLKFKIKPQITDHCE